MKKFLTLLFFVLLTFSLTACSSNKDETEMNEEGMSENMEGMDHGSMNDEDSKNTSTSNVNSTKNVTRLDVNDLVEASVKVSQTIWPATQNDNRPGAVILAPVNNWQISLASTDLIHHPNNGPVLFYEEGKIPTETLEELERLAPLGNSDGTQVMVMGDVSQKILNQLDDYSVEHIKGTNAAEFAVKVDEKYAEVAGELPQSVIIVSSEENSKLYSLIAANWIAHMPEPILFVTKDEVPEETKMALNKRNNKANIYILGSESVISAKIQKSLEEFGTVTRIEGDTPVTASIAFAKFKDKKTGFGWGITEPGHGMDFISTQNAEFAIAGASFAHLGKHAPLIWLEDGKLSNETHEYLVQLQPIFTDDPTIGPYNHAYILGSGESVSMQIQGVIDQMLEISSTKGDHSSH